MAQRNQEAIDIFRSASEANKSSRAPEEVESLLADARRRRSESREAEEAENDPNRKSSKERPKLMAAFLKAATESPEKPEQLEPEAPAPKKKLSLAAKFGYGVAA